MIAPEKMSEQAADHRGLPASVNADIRGSLVAIRRAAQRARLVAQQTGTDLIVMKAGHLVRMQPQKKDPA